jgi:filamentous hemagglutinin family protein
MKIQYLLSLLSIFAITSIAPFASAQTYQPSDRIPVADNSLGTQVSGANNNFTITGGLDRGQNLFHSFTDFSVPTGGAATFDNSLGKQSIITRVTGRDFSDINGLVNTQGANFFLINPNGIVFGTNAQLNVGQTFVGSTANGIDLVDGGGNSVNFGIDRSEDAKLLTINPNALFNVSSLNMGGGNGQISNFGTLQTTGLGQYIGLIGGNVNFNGGGIIAFSGRVELGGLSAPGTVILGVEGNNLRAQFPNNVMRGDVSLTDRTRVFVAGVGNGDVAITAKNLEILGGSVVSGGIIFAGFPTPGAVAGDIKINATGAVLVSASGINNDVKSNSTGKSGNIIIEAGSLSLRNRAQIASSTFGKGNAGNVTMIVKGAVSFVDPLTGIFSNVEAGGEGKGGNIDIIAVSLSMQNGSQLVTATRGISATQPAGKGDAGNVNVTVTEGAVDIDGKVGTLSSGILSFIGTGAEGKGGDITIDAKSLSFQDGAQFQTVTFGRGDAGNINVKAKDAVSVVDASMFTSVGPGGEGKGGNISVNAGSLSLQDGAQFQTTIQEASANQPAGQGKAGNVIINVIGAVDIAGIKEEVPTSIRSFVDTGTKGNAGDITIDTGSFSLRDGATLVAGTRGQGNAGTIQVNATDFFTITGKLNNLTGLLVNSQSLTGTAGDIIVTSPKIFLDNGGAIAAQSRFGNGGNIRIGSNALNQSVSGQDNKTNKEEYRVIILRRGAQISTNTQQDGDGGNITITAPNGFIVTAPNENSDISANGFSGSGGKVTINTQQNFWISPLSRAELEKLLGTTDPTLLNPFNLPTNNITAISQVNPTLNGQVTTTPPEIDPSRGLSPLPNNVTDPSNQIDPNCSAKAIGNNSFTNVGRGGIPATPKDPLNEQEIATNWVRFNPKDAVVPSTPIAATPSFSQHRGKPIVEAQGWRRERNGDIVLVAGSSIGTLPRPAQPQSGCAVR